MKKILLTFSFCLLLFVSYSQQIVKQGESRFPGRYKDSFGFLRTSLGGVTTWTDRNFRSTGIVLPHIAKGDVWSYNIQINHDFQIENSYVDDFHLHFSPVAATAAGQKIKISYSYGAFKFGDVIPATLPYTGEEIYTFTANVQYANIYSDIIENINMPLSNTPSSFIFIVCKRVDDLHDTYSGEIALFGADCHYFTDRLGSKNSGSEQ